mgnify:CR=1 FL=1|tara:strand:- start:4 stop:918 length:915 start_codon:yes stop_codon:yes gene_type:complete
MLYIVLNCDIFASYSSKDQAINFVLDYINIKLKLINELDNVEFNFKDIYKNIHIVKTEVNTTNIYEDIYYNIEEYNFIDVASSTKFITEDKNINYKLNNLKEMIIKIINNSMTDSSSDENMYLNSSSSFKISSINDESSDVLDTDKIQEIVYSNNDENIEDKMINNLIKNNDEDKILNNLIKNNEDQNSEDSLNNKNVIKNQTELLNELVEKKKKLEKLQEIVRKFNIDYDLYVKMKIKYDINNVPDIFKDKFILFNELEKNKIFENKNKCRKIYINNYDKININYNSSYDNLFSKYEKEEDLV